MHLKHFGLQLTALSHKTPAHFNLDEYAISTSISSPSQDMTFQVYDESSPPWSDCQVITVDHRAWQDKNRGVTS